ncbi:hypothetical protein E3N88_29226 [Mikania micrantha]|uniref:DUF676 domain-containing protein n=1 Tax=Mikania micrantha TaxID=192012 RepID=A0A5N6MIM9_9ASTR|nr:hypothetical protein E3N88_29226 [Mikania micrantha]
MFLLAICCRAVSKVTSRRSLVHCSERNATSQTLEGVDIMDERLSEEISFVAHSVGGLVQDMLLGDFIDDLESIDDLLVANSEETKATIGGLIRVNFVTLATPCLGSRGNKQVVYLNLLLPFQGIFLKEVV